MLELLSVKSRTSDEIDVTVMEEMMVNNMPEDPVPVARNGNQRNTVHTC